MIKFGTDGWRAKMAEDFTFDNVALVTQALVEYAKAAGLDQKGIVVGYDNRLDSENFALTAAEITSGAGIKTLLTNAAVPTPVVSYSVKNLGYGLGIMITASHNPPEWNGFKIKESFGGSAFPETTREVEKRVKNELTIKPSTANLKIFDPVPAYLEHLNSFVKINELKNSPIKIVFDPMFGSGLGYFAKLGLPVTEVRGYRDTKFGGINPEPLPVNLQSTISFIQDFSKENKEQVVAGIVVDGDADRIAALDSSGRFINTHNIFVLLLLHLYKHRKTTGEVVKTFNLSNLIDLLCQAFGLKLSVTPIGFKHIAKLMMERDVLLGGEESGGMGIKGNIPERDGLLAGLMLMELMMREKAGLAKILDGIMDHYGWFYYDRVDKHTDQAQEIVKKSTQQPPATFGGLTVNKVETLDGLKLNFADNSWILFRASGTEPLLRIYCEGRSLAEVQQLLAAGEKLISPQ